VTRWNGWGWGRRHWPIGCDGSVLALAHLEAERHQHTNTRCPICGLVMAYPHRCRDCSRWVCGQCYRWEGPACVECLSQQEEVPAH